MNARERVDVKKYVDSVDEAYKALAMAVIVQAADDYRRGLEIGDEDLIRRQERFFRSSMFSLYAGKTDPEFIIGKIRKEVEDGRY